MSKRSYSPKEIVGILRDVDILRGKGKSAAESCRELGVSEAGYYRLVTPSVLLADAT